ncbi:hypothetical protein FISHEDRAFT_55307 [Fistulina hepatica ATCC 64428]|uniref:F-box domain-containing protein n=1 Tax=Fistulina hepatica ATCC 64428 TaxID=1128425 RepID=A0A0D7ANA6_9AGAR|nr:hypothetical protein FISHEDRAFT_55307 [Fistulina hepatica ATCC 64428]
MIPSVLPGAGFLKARKHEPMSPDPLQLVDLIEEIVEKVSLDDHYTLRACTLVSRSFRRPSQKCLFASLTIKKRNVRQFHTLARSSSHVASYIRKLEIIAVPDATDAFPGEAWDAFFREDLPLMLFIHRLSVKCDFMAASALDWSRISCEIQCSLARVLRLPTLRELSLAYVTRFPIRFFAFCGKLQSLEVWDVFFEGKLQDESMRSVEWPTAPPELESISLGYMATPQVKCFVEALLDVWPIMDLSRLARLRLLPTNGGANASTPLSQLIRCAPRLELIEIDVDIGIEGLRPPDSYTEREIDEWPPQYMKTQLRALDSLLLSSTFPFLQTLRLEVSGIEVGLEDSGAFAALLPYLPGLDREAKVFRIQEAMDLLSRRSGSI